MEPKFAEIILENRPSWFWRALKQLGVDYVDGVLPRWFRDWRQVEEEKPWDYEPLMRYKQMLEENGLRLVAIEDNPPMDGVRLGIRELKEEELDAVARLIENMGKLGIKIWIYNWMAGILWSRTRTHIQGRGGMYVTGFSIDDIKNAPEPAILKRVGKVTHEDLWRNLKDFLEYIIPIAEQYDVKLAIHPDDPPIPDYRGIPRIMNSVEAFEKLMALVKSEHNGITFCMGNFTLMTDDIANAIRKLKDRIYFVHFRDVQGDKYNFVETLIGEGKTDLVKAAKALLEIDHEWYLRVDHTPTLENDVEFVPGYSYLGRIYSIGYIKGLFTVAIKQRNN
ncbi:mannonate dehydratase related protein [Vulcanisaeta moutnovskia 768-28]|uniref:mannonate dehydratase n=1 Tax=Vulcanisaeta moutnovskia (strain 768-28) TaxID=985053 RepID=F0QYL3_VULM7|nr:mannonate dehydratase [Vulcanisaeta moutnovskia]ADY01446.1 mannonate dehydratase related protein [Vulcanisaeta moutnovskia 768-28]